MEEDKKQFRNPWDIHPNRAKREWWTDKSKEYKITDPTKMDTHIMGGSKQEEAKVKISKFFKWLPGETKSVFPKSKLFQDKNKNGVPDAFEKK